MAHLLDSSGDAIFSNDGLWYKIQLADGTELGLGEKSGARNGRTKLRVVPSGQGIVFRYQRHDGESQGSYGWPSGDKGYLRGLQVEPDGSETILNMSISGGAPHLCMYNDNSNYGVIANQLPHNRVALYGYDGHGRICGLRVAPDRSIIGHVSAHALALDCAFVRVNAGRFTGFF
jgi:hypothetical protein